jgi:hypothetical protein
LRRALFDELAGLAKQGVADEYLDKIRAIRRYVLVVMKPGAGGTPAAPAVAP